MKKILQETILGFDNFITVVLVVSVIILIIFTILIIKAMIDMTIHKSYHKGYNECRNDELMYHQSIRDLENGFKDVITLIDMEGLSFSFKTTQAVIKYNELIKKYRDKY